ncbi:hypothetical protein WJX72_003079 [[Myrmecia] bisecta]|uniref:EF-hand domain-containing protein n=1 Tax=[Myrmecia] bisecta TaxID=41462 RepID=A0AAW1QPV6_9CHLO
MEVAPDFTDWAFFAERAARQATLLVHYATERWMCRRGHPLPPPPLDSNEKQVLRDWFEAVDEDGSGTLEYSELAEALKAAHIPCTKESLGEFIRTLDVNKDKRIEWSEFEAFTLNEIARGKRLLDEDYVLPSGLTIPFGSMIAVLQRKRLLDAVMQGGTTRDQVLARALATKAAPLMSLTARSQHSMLRSQGGTLGSHGGTTRRPGNN